MKQPCFPSDTFLKRSISSVRQLERHSRSSTRRGRCRYTSRDSSCTTWLRSSRSRERDCLLSPTRSDSGPSRRPQHSDASPLISDGSHHPRTFFIDSSRSSLHILSRFNVRSDFIAGSFVLHCRDHKNRVVRDSRYRHHCGVKREGGSENPSSFLRVFR